MKITLTTLVAVICMCGAGTSVQGNGPEKNEPHGQVFPLKHEPLPAEHRFWIAGWRACPETPISEMPPGVEGVEAIGREIEWSGGARGRYQLLLVKSDREQKRHDKLYLDANGNGRYETRECYDITRSNGLVRLTDLAVSNGGRSFRRLGSKKDKSKSDYCMIVVGPIKLSGERVASVPAPWVGLRALRYPQAWYVSYANLTYATGLVKLGHRPVQLGIYSAELPGRYNRCVRFPDTGGEQGRLVARDCCRLLLDVNRNGRFDVHGMTPEYRPLAWLVRHDGAYYALRVAEHGRSIRIVPSKPRVGTLRIPDGITWASLISPELASVARHAGQIELPAGRYIASEYEFCSGLGSLRVCDYSAKRPFDIKEGQVTALNAGPPLGLRITSSQRRRESVAGSPGYDVVLHLVAADCAGRQIADVQTEGGGNPAPPQLKIVDAVGKTVLSDAFRYG